VEEPTDSFDQPPRPRRGGALAFVLAAGVGAALVFLLVKDSLTDDAYITLAYARNVATDLHWGLIPQEVSNSATSPLNILLLALSMTVLSVFGEVRPVLGLGALTVGLTMITAWGWVGIVRALRLPMAAAAVGVAVMLLNPFVLSAIGLEVVLIPTVLTLLVITALKRRPVWFGIVSALAIMTRLDLVVFVLAVAFGTAAIRRRLHVAVIAAIVVAAPWYVFSWLTLGSAVPDTLVIKTTQPGLFGEWSFVTGPIMYFIGQPLAVGIAFLPAALGAIAVVGWLTMHFAVRWDGTSPVATLAPAAALGFGGIAYYVVYSLMGVGPYHWYFVPPIVSLSMFLAVAVGAWLSGARREAWLRAGTAATALGIVGLLAAGTLAVDLRQGVPWKSPIIFGNWASAHDYAAVGVALRDRVGDATVQSPGEIGTLAFYCECAIVDEFSDRGRVLEKVNRAIDGSGGLVNLGLRANYANLDRTIPPRPIDYRLEYASGPATGPDSWTVFSAAKGVGHFTLVPAAG